MPMFDGALARTLESLDRRRAVTESFEVGYALRRTGLRPSPTARMPIDRPDAGRTGTAFWIFAGGEHKSARDDSGCHRLTRGIQHGLARWKPGPRRDRATVRVSDAPCRARLQAGRPPRTDDCAGEATPTSCNPAATGSRRVTRTCTCGRPASRHPFRSFLLNPRRVALMSPIH